MKILKLLLVLILLFVTEIIHSQQIKSLKNEILGVDPNDVNWIATDANPNNRVLCTTRDGSDLYIGGMFTSIGGITANRVARYNTITKNWSALIDASGNNGVNSSVWRILTDGNRIFIAGDFTNLGTNGVTSYHRGIVYFDKYNNTWNTLSNGLNGSAYSLAIKGDDIYVGGSFTWVGSLPISTPTAFNLIGKWNPTTGWSPLGKGASGSSQQVSTLLIDGDLLYAGGWFTQVTNTSGIAVPDTKYMAVWNINTSTWSSVKSGYAVADRVTDIIKLNESIYITGYFTQVGSINVNYVAKWDGSSWNPVGGGFNQVGYKLATDGKNLFATGSFTMANQLTTPTSANYIAKWDGTSWSSLGTGLDNMVHWGLAFVDYDLYVGGYFTRAGDKYSPRLAVWKTQSEPVLNLTNYLINSLTSATLGANVITDGGYPIIERGIVISTTAYPTIADQKYSSQGAAGSFSIDAINLLPNTQYHYRGYATNSLGTSYTNDTTFSCSLLPPELVSPLNNSTEVDVNNTFNWNSARFANTYRIQISVNSDMSNPFCDGETNNLSYFSDYLKYGNTYYWRLQSIQSPISGIWSDTWKFTTKTSNITFIHPSSGQFLISLLNFGTINPDTGKKQDTIVFRNIGNTNLTIMEKVVNYETLLNLKRMEKISVPVTLEEKRAFRYKGNLLSYDSSFIFIKNIFPVTLLPGEEDSVIIQFQPLTLGSHNAIMTIKSTDINASEQKIHLSGIAAGNPELNINVSAINFDTLYSLRNSNTKSLIISNEGNINLSILGKYIEGDDYNNFSFLSGNSPVVIPPNGKDTMIIRFSSYNTVGLKKAVLYLFSDDKNNPLTIIKLSGYIKSAIINPTGRILFGDLIIGTQKDTFALITNNGNAPLRINNSYIDGPNSKEFRYSGIENGMLIEPFQSIPVAVNFKPDESGIRYCRVALFSNDGIKPEVSIVLRGNGVSLPLAKPMLIYVKNGRTGVSNNPILVWGLVQEALTYTLMVSKDSSFETSVLEKTDLIEPVYALSNLESGVTYYWKVCAKNDVSTGEWSEVWKFTIGGMNAPMGIDNEVITYSLEQNYPNPFNPSTNIKFSILKSGHTTIKVYNILGKEVSTVADRIMESGEYTVLFNALNLPSGIYYYKLQSGNYKEMKKMILIK